MTMNMQYNQHLSLTKLAYGTNGEVKKREPTAQVDRNEQNQLETV